MTTLVVDTSAAVAIMTGEPGYGELEDHIEQADSQLMSAATLVELGMVMEGRFGDRLTTQVDDFLRYTGIEIADLTEDHARYAREGWRRFGKGRGHPAQLNLGDCYTYGLAASRGCAVLCTGDDFAATDLDVLRPKAGTET